ncbi:Noc2p-Noc3p complex subunit Noc2 family protein [Schizosaccharomyces japonicus yFS275]|uniref:Noc2p-Noc3p complex subunit Noc2 family protein n=1 Tax=Schizosaccharomyces japonicus (strain yFS275 / FY16936) TaxID=402676 RepID=B6K6L1_SCHJY|nr:Noc2p-Noc3p complex subunit Noc2 family protein [Schizosaccharomyces japonicus yFS275]EEB09165.2 Noc2p-Noc3p complex subunit Noc2 family protein [Schizosaccharomyces japonicus yFS275]
MGKALKSTKKFNKNYLRSTLERRQNEVEHNTKVKDFSKEDVTQLYRSLDSKKASVDDQLVDESSEIDSEADLNSSDDAQTEQESKSLGHRIKSCSEKELGSIIAYCQELSGTKQEKSALKALPRDVKQSLDEQTYTERGAVVLSARLHLIAHQLKNVTEDNGQELYQSISENLKKVKSFPSDSSINFDCVFTHHLWSSSLFESASQFLHKCLKIDASLAVRFIQPLYAKLISQYKDSHSLTEATVRVTNVLKEIVCLNPATFQKVSSAYIGQITAHLQRCMKKPSDITSLKLLYNWQFVMTLDLWVEFVGHAWTKLGKPVANKVMPSLIDTVLTTISLLPSENYYPLRLKLLASLIQLCQTTGVFVPLSSVILQMIPSLLQPHSVMENEPVDLSTVLHLTKDELNKSNYRTALRTQALYLLAKYFAIYSTSIAFPELATPVIIQLRKLLTQIRHEKKTAQILSKLEEHFSYIEMKRADIEFNPRNLTAIDKFESSLDPQSTPLGVFLRS